MTWQCEEDQAKPQPPSQGTLHSGPGMAGTPATASALKMAAAALRSLCVAYAASAMRLVIQAFCRLALVAWMTLKCTFKDTQAVTKPCLFDSVPFSPMQGRAWHFACSSIIHACPSFLRCSHWAPWRNWDRFWGSCGLRARHCGYFFPRPSSNSSSGPLPF